MVEPAPQGTSAGPGKIIPVVALSLLCWPAGLIWLWMGKGFSKRLRVTVTCVAAVSVFLSVALAIGLIFGPKSASSPVGQGETVGPRQETPGSSAEPAKPTAEPKGVTMKQLEQQDAADKKAEAACVRDIERLMDQLRSEVVRRGSSSDRAMYEALELGYLRGEDRFPDRAEVLAGNFTRQSMKDICAAIAKRCSEYQKELDRIAQEIRGQ